MYTTRVIADRGVDPFFGFGGGGGKSKENFNIFGRAKSQYKTLRTAQNGKLCMFSSIFMFLTVCLIVLLNLFLHYILLIFQVVEIIGGGGGQNDMFATQIFSLGGDCPLLPPPPGSTPLIADHNSKLVTATLT